MSKISRRSLICAAAAVPALAAPAREPVKPGVPFRRRTHPLEGIAREKIRIGDVKVTLLSYELKDKAWFTATQLIWKSDCVLVEMFKDPLVVKNGYMNLPARPGFGMELKPGLQQRFPYLPGTYWKSNPFLPAVQ